jgi:hypothetical protein
MIYPRSSSLKYDLIVYIEADICGISLSWCGTCNRHPYNICVSDIIYNVHDFSVLYNDNVGPSICEDWSLTRMLKGPALPDNATKRMIEAH